MICTWFTDIAAVTSMSEVLPEALPRSFKYAHTQTKPARLQNNAVYTSHQMCPRYILIGYEMHLDCLLDGFVMGCRTKG